MEIRRSPKTVQTYSKKSTMHLGLLSVRMESGIPKGNFQLYRNALATTVAVVDSRAVVLVNFE